MLGSLLMKISVKKQRKFAKIILRGAKRQEKQIKKKLKKLNKQIEKAKSQES